MGSTHRVSLAGTLVRVRRSAHLDGAGRRHAARATNSPASPPRSQEERVAAQLCLADVELAAFLDEPLVAVGARRRDPAHPRSARRRGVRAGRVRCRSGNFATGCSRTRRRRDVLASVAWGLTPEMVAAVSKVMGNQDLVLVASKCSNVTAFRSTIGLPGRLSVRLQPNHPTDDLRGIMASVVDGLLSGCGDAVIGINPALDSPQQCRRLLEMLDHVITRYDDPDAVVRARPRDHDAAVHRGGCAGRPRVPVDRRHRGDQPLVRRDARAARRSARRGHVAASGARSARNVMYFETGQGSCLSAGGAHGVDQQTLEARAYAVARQFDPLLVNSVVGFIGPEYLLDGKQVIRAGLEDHFCGKLLGLPMGCDVCYTNHMDVDQDDMDVLLTLLGAAGLQLHHGGAGRRRRDARLPVDARSTTPTTCASCSGCARPRSSSNGWSGCASPTSSGDCVPPGGRSGAPGCAGRGNVSEADGRASGARS